MIYRYMNWRDAGLRERGVESYEFAVFVDSWLC